MVQIRLTKKFVNYLKIKSLPAPKPVISVFDDWIIDNLILNRKKIAMATHVETRLTFFFPYILIGGAKNVAGFISAEIEGFIEKNKLKKQSKELNTLFENINYCANTADKSLIANMKDLKKMFLAHTHDCKFEEIHWNDVNDEVNNIIISFKSSNEKYVSPNERMINLLKNQ